MSAIAQRRQELALMQAEERHEAIVREKLRQQLSAEGVLGEIAASNPRINHYNNNFSPERSASSNILSESTYRENDLSNSLSRRDYDDVSLGTAKGAGWRGYAPEILEIPGRKVSINESSTFLPSYSWQIVQPDQECPPGMEVQSTVDGTGRTQVRMRFISIVATFFLSLSSLYNKIIPPSCS